MAGHQAEDVVEQLFAAGRLVLAAQVIDDSLKQVARRPAAQQRRVAVQEQRTAAEILHVQTQLGEALPVFQRLGPARQLMPTPGSFSTSSDRPSLFRWGASARAIAETRLAPTIP